MKFVQYNFQYFLNKYIQYKIWTYFYFEEVRIEVYANGILKSKVYYIPISSTLMLP